MGWYTEIRAYDVETNERVADCVGRKLFGYEENGEDMRNSYAAIGYLCEKSERPLDVGGLMRTWSHGSLPDAFKNVHEVRQFLNLLCPDAKWIEADLKQFSEKINSHKMKAENTRHMIQIDLEFY